MDELDSHRGHLASTVPIFEYVLRVALDVLVINGVLLKCGDMHTVSRL